MKNAGNLISIVQFLINVYIINSVMYFNLGNDGTELTKRRSSFYLADFHSKLLVFVCGGSFFTLFADRLRA